MGLSAGATTRKLLMCAQPIAQHAAMPNMRAPSFIVQDNRCARHLPREHNRTRSSHRCRQRTKAAERTLNTGSLVRWADKLMLPNLQQQPKNVHAAAFGGLF